MTTPPLSGFLASQRAIQARCVHPSGRSPERVVDTFALDVPVHALLEAPTVAAMALVVLERGIESHRARLRPDDEPVPGATLA